MELFLVVLVTTIFPPILIFGFFVVNPRQEIVVLRFGKYVTTLKTQGIGLPLLCLELILTRAGQQTVCIGEVQ